MAYTAVPTVNTGDPWTAANHNQYVRDNFAWVNSFKGVSVRRSATLSIPDTTPTAISWDAEHHDVTGFHVAGSTDIVIPAGYTGYYHIHGLIQWQSSAVGSRKLRLLINGGGGRESVMETPSAGIKEESIDWTFKLNAGDVITVNAVQTSGGNLNINSGSFLALDWIGA